MRLFVGVALPQDIRAQVGRIISQLRQRPGLDNRAVRWVPVDNLHFTVQFLGEVAVPRVAEICAALSSPWRQPPFTLALAGGGTFPVNGRPRVVWLGLADGAPALRALHEECETRLRELGFQPETRPYRAHLTIGRFRRPGAESRTMAREAFTRVDVPESGWSADQLVLFQSVLRPSGAQYKMVASLPLMG